MQNESRISALKAVLGQPHVQPFEHGQILSIMNNDNHPTLTRQGVAHFQEASVLLQTAIGHLQPLFAILADYPIRLNEFSLALNHLNAYIYILDATLDTPQNLRMASYAVSAKVGAA